MRGRSQRRCVEDFDGALLRVEMDSMVVSIDATGLGRAKTGTAVYLSEILRVWNAKTDLKHRFVLFISLKTRHYFDDLGLDERFEFRFAPDNRFLRLLWQQTILPIRIFLLGCDVHWGTGFVLPLLGGCKSVVTIHDITFQLFPEVHEKSKRWYFPQMIKRAVSKAQAIIAISETTKRDLVALYPSSAQKVRVTLLAARPLTNGGDGFKGGDGAVVQKDPYILAIGTLEPRKNLMRLIRAWLSIPLAIRGRTRLLIAGAYGWMADNVQSHVSSDDAGVQFLGFVDEPELAALLENAMALAYPSLYEGFGLPVIEAMAMGVPVLTSATGATQEVAQDAALLVDPRDEREIRMGLERLIGDTEVRKELSRRGRVRAASFSWEKTAQETLAVLEQAQGG